MSAFSLCEDDSLIEEICTLFLPISRTSNGTWEYSENDHIAFQALIRYMFDCDQQLSWERMTADRLFALISEQRAVTGEVGEFIMESLLISSANSGLSLSSFPAFQKIRETVYGDCFLELKIVDRNEDSFFDIISSCNFEALCMNVDKMARFDFFCLGKHPNDDFILAIFGGCKLYSRNVNLDVFCDNIISTDPNNAYLNAGGKILNQEKRKRFTSAWNSFITNHKVKILRIVFTYPQPVGSVEYPESRIYEFAKNQLILFLGFDEIDRLPKGELNLSALARISTGWKVQSRREGTCAVKSIRQALTEFCKSKEQQISFRKKDIQLEQLD
jgi:hypothetical protein